MLDKKTVVIMIGIPGSGKSTWLEKHYKNAYIISADKIREEWYGDVNIQGNGKKVFEEVFKRFENALKSEDKVVIAIDNTSVSFKSRKSYYDIISKEFNEEIKDHVNIKLVFFDDFKLAKERNKSRERVVPEEVLDKMISNYEGPNQYEKSISKNIISIKG